MVGVSGEQKAVVSERGERVCKVFEHVDSILPLKVGGADRAEFELQNKLSDEPFFVTRSERTVQRNFAALDRRCIGTPAVEVLHMDTVDMPE